jgi:hypothetical protein
VTILLFKKFLLIDSTRHPQVPILFFVGTLLSFFDLLFQNKTHFQRSPYRSIDPPRCRHLFEHVSTVTAVKMDPVVCSIRWKRERTFAIVPQPVETLLGSFANTKRRPTVNWNKKRLRRGSASTKEPVSWNHPVRQNTSAIVLNNMKDR